MSSKQLYSHAELEPILRRAGYSSEQIKEILGGLPDPFDPDRDGEALFALGISLDHLTDRMGGSP